MTNNIVLSRRNAFRAKTVRSKANPEVILPFNYFGTVSEINGSKYHSVGELEGAEIVITPDLHKWEVVEFKHEALLDEYWDVARHAYYWSSFSPDERGEQTILSYENELREDIANMPEAQRERYISNYKSHFGTWLSSLGNCASAMVTGPAKFNHRRNDKANNREHKVLNEFRAWRERALSAIEKHIENCKPEEQKHNEAWEHLKRDILGSAITINEINEGRSYYTKALFVGSIYGKTETFAKHGNVFVVENAIAFIRELNAKYRKPIITERHKFFKLLEVVQTNVQKEEENASKENKEVAFDGGTIVWNYAEDRLQVLFDEKPDYEMRTRLKREAALKWAPSQEAWQRKLTRNAECDVLRLFNLENVA